MTSRRISFATDQNEIIQPLLTDLYQLKMAYAYWKSEKSSARAVFDLFFRKNPFEGEFTIFAGLEEVLKFLQKFRYTKSDIQYIREILPPTVENEFFEYLENLNLKEVSVYAVPEGTVVFPIEPLIRVEGPLIAAQLLETTLLNLVNYACLVATNAARYRIAAGSLQLYEFGLRRAQGPDGGLSASRYCYIGGFDGTSNVLAGKMYDIPVRGTQAHSYITSFTNLRELSVTTLIPKDGSEPLEFMQPALEWRNKLPHMGKTIGQPNDGELAAFISYAIAFPSNFIALVDTYNVLKSGIFNFCAVALTLNQFGHDAIGIRLDSGDLAYISNLCREYFTVISQQYDIPSFADKLIMASSNIDDDTILSLSEQGHSINAFGIGTHLVTCQKQPALGGVYKMVEMEGDPRMKLSHDVEKISIPGRKEIYRLYGVSGYALMDILQRTVEECPAVNKKVLCRHPFQENKRAFVVPTEVEKLLVQYWKDGRLCQSLPSIKQIQERVENSLKILRPDVKRSLNPTPYKVSVSDSLYNFFHYLWLKNIPVGELS